MPRIPCSAFSPCPPRFWVEIHHPPPPKSADVLMEIHPEKAGAAGGPGIVQLDGIPITKGLPYSLPRDGCSQVCCLLNSIKHSGQSRAAEAESSPTREANRKC